MKKLIAIVLLVWGMGCGISWGAGVESSVRLTLTDFKTLLKGKLVGFTTAAVARDDGRLFFLGRDEATRDLEWFLVDPFERRLVAHGACPFKVFTRATVSPDGKVAAAFSRYPTALWMLDVAAGTWKMIYKNSTYGATIVTGSPLSLEDSQRADSVLDHVDSDGYVVDTDIVSIALSPFSLDPITSMATLQKASIQKVFKSASKGVAMEVDYLRLAADKTFVYVLKTVDRKARKAADYLMQFSGPVALLQQVEGRILPLDYRSSPIRVLYRTSVGEKATVFLLQDGKPSRLLDIHAVAGCLMDDGSIGLSAIENDQFNVMVGKPGGSFATLATARQPFSVAFMRSGERLVMLNAQEIRAIKIKK